MHAFLRRRGALVITRALAGAREVRVVVGPATELKRFEDALAKAREGTSDDRVRVVVVPIVRQRWISCPLPCSGGCR